MEDTVDLALLVGQQLRVTLTSVFDLTQFTINFENITTKCCAHNIEVATDMYVDALKRFINETIIIYIDDVKENVLIVTIYDANGDKVVILTPDEGAFDNVDLLCALPVFTTTINGYVSHVTKESICLQPTKYNEKLSCLLNKMYEYYNVTEPENITVVADDVYAVLSYDGNWYRGRAVNIDNDDVHIIYVDYGNQEIVNAAKLKTLDKEFLKEHMLAFKVFVMEDPAVYFDKNVTMKLWYGDNGWEGEIINENNLQQIFDSPAIKFNELSPVNVQVQENEEQLEVVVLETEIPPNGSNSLSEKPDAADIETESEIHVDKGLSVILSHADSPSDFYLQLQEDESIVNNLQWALQEQIESLNILENPTAGVLCAALYTVDQQWYRAQILDYDTDIITVRFVDYGNTDVLDNNNTTIKTLPIELITLAQYARRCSLRIKSVDTEWSAAAFQRFTELTDAASYLSVEVIDQDEKITYVNLYCDGTDIGETLIQEGQAIKLELDLEATCTGFISHLNSPSEFYVQLESAVGDLEWTADQLASAENFVEIQDLTPGALCAAVYPEDEMWYRARILSNTVAGLEVLFVDYGNSCTCSNMKELPEELVMLPPLAQKCSLAKPGGLLQWSPQSNEKFREISADGAAVFTVNKIKPGETTVVQLLLNGEDISQQLLPSLERGRVVKVEALDKVFVIREKDQDKLNSILEKLENMTENKLTEGAKDDLVMCDVDGKMQRATLLSINTNKEDTDDSLTCDKSLGIYKVKLIDSICTINVDVIYELPEDCKDLYVSIYKLDSLPGIQFTDECLSKLIEINEKGSFD